MKLDDLARSACVDLDRATRDLPVVPIERIRRRRRVLIAAPVLTAVGVVIAGFVILGLIGDDRPVVTETTVTDTTVPDTTSTTAPPPAPVEFNLDHEGLTPQLVEQWPYSLIGSALFGPAASQLSPGGGGAFAVLDDGRVVAIDPGSGRLVFLGAGAEALAPLPDGFVATAVASQGQVVYVAGGRAEDPSSPWELLAVGIDGRALGGAQFDPPALPDALRVTVSGGDVWVGTLDSEWQSLMTVEGVTLPPDDRRVRPGMPTNDGGWINAANGVVTRLFGDGAEVRWTLPSDLDITAVAATDQGVFVTTGSAPDGPVYFSQYAFEVTRTGEVIASTMLRTFHTSNRHPAQMTLIADGTVYAMETQTDRLSVVRFEPPAPVTAALTIDPSALGVVVANYPSNLTVQGVEHRLADSLPDFTALALYGIETVAWDGGEGVAYLDSLGQVHHLGPDGDRVAFAVPESFQFGMAELVDVVDIDGQRLVAIVADGRIRWFDLATGAELEGPIPSPLEIDEFGRLLAMSAHGRTVRLEQPEYSYGEDGQRIGPFTPAVLRVTDGSGLTVMEVGSDAEPWTRLHAFDGRRVVVSREPDEPAAAPRTVFVIDLECPDCLEVLFVGPDSVDLIGELPIEGAVVGQNPVACSAGAATPGSVASAEGIPAAVMDLAEYLAQELRGCAMGALDGMGVMPVAGSAPHGWRTVEQTMPDFTAQALAALTRPPARIDRNGRVVWVWPGGAIEDEDRFGETVRVEIAELSEIGDGLPAVVWIGAGPS